jgi:HlyD family secretion protein
MPDPTNNSSSVLPKPTESEQRSYIASEEDIQVADNRHQSPTTNETRDWYYGTEELLDALPRIWTRSLLYFLVGFTVIVLPWSMLSKVDETGNARGRIEPKGATQRIDAVASGKITAVRAKTGQAVQSGQLLVEIESDVLRSEFQQAKTRLEGLQSRQAQLELVRNQVMLAMRVQEQQNRSQILEKTAEVNQAKQNIEARKSSYNLQKLEKSALVDQAQQNLNSSEGTYQIANSRLQRDLSEVQRFRQLFEAGVIPETKIVELEKIAEESQELQERAVSENKQAQLRLKEEQSRYQSILNQGKSDIKQAELTLQQQQSSFEGVVHAGNLAVLRIQEQLKDIETQVTTLQSEIAQTKSQIQSINLQIQQRALRSPINGTIFQMPITKPGVVVQPGEMVAQIAPQGSSLILKAQMNSQQSGFVRVGMPVKIKFDAFPFQDYGVVQGRVSWIAPDSKVEETIQGKVESFDVEITLSQPYIQNGKKRIAITPGQTATAEVIIRQRRVIDFLLDPFKKLQKDGLAL